MAKAAPQSQLEKGGVAFGADSNTGRAPPGEVPNRGAKNVLKMCLNPGFLAHFKHILSTFLAPRFGTLPGRVPPPGGV